MDMQAMLSGKDAVQPHMTYDGGIDDADAHRLSGDSERRYDNE